MLMVHMEQERILDYTERLIRLSGGEGGFMALFAQGSRPRIKESMVIAMIGESMESEGPTASTGMEEAVLFMVPPRMPVPMAGIFQASWMGCWATLRS